jgi:hypothetical protein
VRIKTRRAMSGAADLSGRCHPDSGSSGDC